jgi:hypothetical protein
MRDEKGQIVVSQFSIIEFFPGPWQGFLRVYIALQRTICPYMEFFGTDEKTLKNSNWSVPFF